MIERMENTRRRFFSNNLHRELFFLLLIVSVVPALITAIALYYIISQVLAQEMIFIDKLTIYNMGPVAEKLLLIAIVAVPLSALILVVFAHQITRRFVGPFDRIVRELDEYIEGKRKGRIRLRPDDKFWPLVDQINLLIDRLNREPKGDNR